MSLVERRHVTTVLKRQWQKATVWWKKFYGVVEVHKTAKYLSSPTSIFNFVGLVYNTPPPPKLNVNIKTVTDFVQYKFIKLFSLHNLKVQSLDINS